MRERLVYSVASGVRDKSFMCLPVPSRMHVWNSDRVWRIIFGGVARQSVLGARMRERLVIDAKWRVHRALDCAPFPSLFVVYDRMHDACIDNIRMGLWGAR